MWVAVWEGGYHVNIVALLGKKGQGKVVAELVICRALVHYKGVPDPFKGDLLNQKVRETAKEAVEAMFAPTETPSYSQAPSSIQVSFQLCLQRSSTVGFRSCVLLHGELNGQYHRPQDVLAALIVKVCCVLRSNLGREY